MGFRKCPRCELNYITDNETLCKVCKREIKGDDRLEVIDLCTVCNERPVMPGKDILDETDDIPAGELEEIENDLSLDEMSEEEDSEDEEDDPFEE